MGEAAYLRTSESEVSLKVKQLSYLGPVCPLSLHECRERNTAFIVSFSILLFSILLSNLSMFWIG